MMRAKPAKIPTNVGLSHAHTMARFWWNRYRELPRWRWFARREANHSAAQWAELVKQLHAEAALLSSEHDPPREDPSCPG